MGFLDKIISSKGSNESKIQELRITALNNIKNADINQEFLLKVISIDRVIRTVVIIKQLLLV